MSFFDTVTEWFGSITSIAGTEAEEALNEHAANEGLDSSGNPLAASAAIEEDDDNWKEECGISQDTELTSPTYVDDGKDMSFIDDISEEPVSSDSLKNFW